MKHVKVNTSPKPLPDPALASDTWSIPVIRGIQSNREYYTAMIRVANLRRILNLSEKAKDRNIDWKPGDFKSLVQRSINPRRVKKLVEYIFEGLEASAFKSRSTMRAKGYVLSSLTCVFDPGTEYEFQASSEGSDMG